MNILYCDLCQVPLKEHGYYTLYTTYSRNIKEPEDYLSYLKKIDDEKKEICANCKHIFDKIFELKLQRLSELTEEINSIYKLPSKKNSKERKNE
jgi:hypothetical protein